VFHWALPFGFLCSCRIRGGFVVIAVGFGVCSIDVTFRLLWFGSSNLSLFYFILLEHTSNLLFGSLLVFLERNSILCPSLSPGFPIGWGRAGLQVF